MTCNFGKYFLEWIDRLGMLSALFEAEGREGIIFTGEKEDFHECPVNVPEKQLEIQWSKIGDPKSTNVHRHASFSGHKLRAFFRTKATRNQALAPPPWRLGRRDQRWGNHDERQMG